MNLWLTAILFFCGMLLSALFSGSETGFYRVNRTRLLLDSRSGDRVSRFLLWLTHQPTLFVATALVGNNVANQLVSLSIVLAAAHLAHATPMWETMLPVLASPVVFIYGELLPKHIFYQAPNRLLRLAGPLFALFTVLFTPLTMTLWLIGRLIEKWIGHTPLRLAMTLARKELTRIFRESEDLGLLEPTQARLAHAIIEAGPQPVRRYVTPLSRVVAVPEGTDVEEIERVARRNRTSVVGIRSRSNRDLLGYIRLVELRLERDRGAPTIHSLPRLPADASIVSAISRLRREDADWGLAVDQNGRPVGIVRIEQVLDRIIPGN